MGADVRRVMPVSVVPMTPAHLDEVSRLHVDAFRAHMNGRLGRRYARALLHWFMTAERGVALVAIANGGQVVGYVAGAPDGYGHALTRALLPAAATSAMLRPWVLFDRELLTRAVARMRSLLARRPATPHVGQRETMALVAIGVASKARGQQVGTALMRAFEQRARCLGMRAVRLSVYEDNVAARRLYERAGWAVVHTHGRAVYFGRTLT